MIKGRLKTREWEAAVKKLHSVGKTQLKKVMEQSAKLVIRDIVAFTPPFGKAPVTEAFKKKKDLGMAAVKSDILKIYSNFKNIGPVKSNSFSATVPRSSTLISFDSANSVSILIKDSLYEFNLSSSSLIVFLASTIFKSLNIVLVFVI